jgi:hypothetical protein
MKNLCRAALLILSALVVGCASKNTNYDNYCIEIIDNKGWLSAGDIESIRIASNSELKKPAWTIKTISKNIVEVYTPFSDTKHVFVRSHDKWILRTEASTSIQ